MEKNIQKLIITDVTVGFDALSSKSIVFCHYIIDETQDVGAFDYELLDKMKEWYKIDWELSFRNCNEIWK